MLITIIIIVVQVKAILVNIFGGIVNCATIANGIIAACKEIQLSLPLVVRLEGEDMQNNNNHWWEMILCSIILPLGGYV